MKLLMIKMMMMQWESVCHKTKWQRNCVLRNCSSALSIYSSHASQPDHTAGYRLFDKTEYFCTIILRLGKMIKPFFYSRQYRNSSLLTFVESRPFLHRERGPTPSNPCADMSLLPRGESGSSNDLPRQSPLQVTPPFASTASPATTLPPLFWGWWWIAQAC